jgi:outer membrane protein
MTILSFAAAILFSLSVQAQTPLKVGFDDLTPFVREKNLHARAGQNRVEAAEKETGHFLRSYLPRLSVEGGGETFQTSPYETMTQPFGSVAANVNLFRGGRDFLEENARRAQLSLSETEAQDIYLEELSKARKAYWNLVFERQLQTVLQEALLQNDRNHIAAKIRVSAGLGSETDRYEFEIQKIALEQDLTRVELLISNGERILGVLLGLEQGTKIETTAKLQHQHEDALFTATLDASQHRDVLGQKATGHIAAAKKIQGWRWWTPSIDVYGGYSLYSFREREEFLRRDRNEFFLGAKISIELFDGLQSAASASSQGRLAIAFENQAQQTARELLARFETSKQELQLTHSLIHGAESATEMSRKYLMATISEYQRGQKNSPDVLGAAQRYVDQQRRFGEIARDFQLARSELLGMLGN